MKRDSAILIPLIVALAAIASSLLMISHVARLPDGTPALALDDSYIHLQYAWQTSQGHFLEYNTGDAPTSGATSLLYMLLLAGGFGVGITRQAMPGVVLGFGGTLFISAAVLLSDLTRRAADELGQKPSWLPGLLAGALFAGSGWMAWAFFSGMETGLLILLVIGTLWASVRRQAILAAVLASLAALTRPEALILGIVMLASESLIQHKNEMNTCARRVLWALMPFGATLLSLALNYLLTGTLGSSGLQAKSLFTLVPFYPERELSMMATNGLELFVRLLGGPASDGRWHTVPFLQILVAAGLVLLWRQPTTAGKRIALISIGWAGVGIAATTTLQTATWHHYRYQMPFYPALIVPTALALAWIAYRAGRFVKLRPCLLTYCAVILPVLIWSLYTVATFAQAYTADTATIVQMQFPLASWLAQNTPPGSRIAVHDVGTMRLVGEHYTIDVVGLTSPGMAGNYRSGPGSIYEALEAVRPDYYAVYPDAAPPFFGTSNASELLGKELFTIKLDSYSPYVSATSTQVITRPDWSDVDQANRPEQLDILSRLDGWTLVDSLDVADLQDELAHHYMWWNAGTLSGFPSDARKMHYRIEPSVTLADGGRLMTGGESFTLRTKPGQPLLLVARLHQTTDIITRVDINGSKAGQWRLPAVPGEWIESIFLVRAGFITSSQTEVAITVEEMFNPGPESRYSPFHYWAYQGDDLTTAVSQPDHVIGARFGDVAQLQGFDLSSDIVVPADTLSVTLHWLRLNPPHANLRVFIHLVDPERADSAEGIITQTDSAPRQGVYPFWVWQPGESMSDIMQLVIPPGTPSGQYKMLIGIYDVATSTRLSVVSGPDFGAGRLLLGTVTVK